MPRSRLLVGTLRCVLPLQIEAATLTQRAAEGRRRRRRAREPTKPRKAAATSVTADSHMYGRHTAQLAVGHATLHSNWGG